MIVFPQNFLSLISLILALFFIQGGLLFLFFYYKVNRQLEYSTREHLYFATMSWAQAIYSIGAWQIYSTKLVSDAAYWQQVQWFAGIMLFICFVLFTCEYLNLKMKWLFGLILIPSLVFAYSALFDSSFLIGPPDLKNFTVFGSTYQVYEMDVGFMAKIASFWMMFFAVLLLLVWFFYLTQHRTKLRAAAFGIIFLVLAGFNELFVSLRYYQSPYVLEYGFFLFSLSFYHQLFSDFFDLYRQNSLRAQDLERLNEESKFFINTVTHDLKSPLLSIDGFVSLVKEEASSLKGSQKDYLTRVQRNVSLMAQLLDELKAFIQIGELPDEREEFEFEEVLNEVLLNMELRLNRFEIKKNISSKLPYIYFSKRRLLNILTNLLDNAVKYAEDVKNPSIEISAERSKDKVHISIRDNGPGIPKEHREKIFQIFYRADSDKPGSGVGLAAVKKMLENAGENIYLKNIHGEGTSFCFTLPISKS